MNFFLLFILFKMFAISFFAVVKRVQPVSLVLVEFASS